MQQVAQIRVLVVEDEAVNRDVVCQMLRHFGHQVEAVDNGRSALNAVQDEVFDLVMMDCRMDDMDGLETTRRLRAGDAGPRGLAIPVIALTAQAFDSDRDACLAAGMNDFLPKPVDIQHLISAVNHWGSHKAQAVAQDGVEMDARTAHTPAAAPPVFDPEVLAALPMVADGSQPGYVNVVLDLYLQTLPELLNVIRQAATSGDTSQAQRAAHSLKSSSAAIGAFAMAACAANAEAHLRFGHQDMSHFPSQFDMEFERLSTMLGRQPAPVQKA